MELGMIIFLLTFLCLYGGINFYAFARARSIFHFPGAVQIIVIVLLVLLILAPVMVRLAENLHLEESAKAIAYIGYLWMAFVFLFFFLSLSFDILRYLAGFFYPGAKNMPLNTIFFGMVVFLSFVLVVYGFLDAQRIRVKKLEVQTEHFLPNDGRIRIVQISDVHVGLIIRGERLQTLIDTVRQANPDILVSTGDLLDGELDNVMPETERFVSIKPALGKYAIMGNHEYYAGIKRSIEFTKKAGFEVLRDEVKQVAGINIFGADDITAERLGLRKDHRAFDESLASSHDKEFVLLLKHQPFVNEKENFNLQLSGHTHGGQIFPFRLITHLIYPKDYGYYELGQNKLLYVSRGTGTWGPPVRIFTPPEITIIDLIGKKAN
jgi:predicted MPP superfamily phosphohydrolase